MTTTLMASPLGGDHQATRSPPPKAASEGDSLPGPTKGAPTGRTLGVIGHDAKAQGVVLHEASPTTTSELDAAALSHGADATAAENTAAPASSGAASAHARAGGGGVRAVVPLLETASAVAALHVAAVSTASGTHALPQQVAASVANPNPPATDRGVRRSAAGAGGRILTGGMPAVSSSFIIAGQGQTSGGHPAPAAGTAAAAAAAAASGLGHLRGGGSDSTRSSPALAMAVPQWAVPVGQAAHTAATRPHHALPASGVLGRGGPAALLTAAVVGVSPSAAAAAAAAAAGDVTAGAAPPGALSHAQSARGAPLGASGTGRLRTGSSAGAGAIDAVTASSGAAAVAAARRSVAGAGGGAAAAAHIQGVHGHAPAASGGANGGVRPIRDGGKQ
jgi:hypothetical protein